MQKGYWNGEYAATFVAVLYKVGQAETQTWWQNRHIGQERQGILITYRGETWLIDNQHGEGYYKVTLGLGSPNVGHKSIANYEIIRELPENEWKRGIDREALKAESEAHDAWLEKNFPEQFAKLQALKEGLKAHREKYKL